MEIFSRILDTVEQEIITVHFVDLDDNPALSRKETNEAVLYREIIASSAASG